MRLLNFAIVFALATAGYADIITLKNGRVINGTYLGGTPREIKVEVDEIQTLNVADVARIQFGSGSAPIRLAMIAPTLRRANPTVMRSDTDDDQRPTLRRGEPTTILHPDADPPPLASAPARAPIEIPEQTNFVVRMIDAIDSEKASLGQSFQASMAEPVIVNGETVIPRGADVVVKLVDSKESGKIAGKAVLTVNLSSVKVNGKMVTIARMSRGKHSRGERTAKVAEPERLSVRWWRSRGRRQGRSGRRWAAGGGWSSGRSGHQRAQRSAHPIGNAPDIHFETAVRI